MKKLLTYLFLFASIAGFSQRNFDSTGCCFGYMEPQYIISLDTIINSDFYIDTVSNPDNVWRVAKPSKNVFDSAYSFPNVILTDTGTSYPVNHHSSFVYKHIPQVPTDAHSAKAEITFHYWVDCHSGDSGMIEFSPDNGITWYDLINDSTVTNHVYWENKPKLTGSMGTWEKATVSWISLVDVFNIQISEDTVQFRFLFLSDSIPNTKDGLMFDHFEIWDSYYDLGMEYFEAKHGSLYPNPSSNEWTIKGVGQILSITVQDATGRKLQPGIRLIQSLATVDIHTLPEGMYFIRVQTEEGNYLLKAVKKD